MRSWADRARRNYAFISYDRQDARRVDRVQAFLESNGVPVWRDTADLWPGEDWQLRVREAITGRDVAFIACFSKHTEIGTLYQREELELAVEQVRQHPRDSFDIVPVRLEDCVIPDYDLGAGRTLASLPVVDLSENRWEQGAGLLLTRVRDVLGPDGDPSENRTPPINYRGVDLKIVHGDALSYPSDVLILKHAQQLYGVDEKVVHIANIEVGSLPTIGDVLLIQEPRGIASRSLLFLGVEPIGLFGYRSIRSFSRRALNEAMRILPPVREISMTLHGVGFGLDETEAFESEVAGIVEALDTGEYPAGLRAVSIIEQNQSRARRMREALAALLSSDEREGKTALTKTLETRRPRRIDSVGYDSAARSHAFVAMPFAESFEDVFYYGIARPIRAAGLLCERIDKLSFTGDIVDRMKDRIASSAVVVADLSDANPNVYLEVGFAWGIKIPCILICNRKTDLKFDLQGQKCLFYSSIMQLEKTLSAELSALGDLRQ